MSDSTKSEEVKADDEGILRIPLLEIPKFQFAVTKQVQTNCPVRVNDIEVKASDFLPRRTRPKDTGYDIRCAAPEGVRLEPFRYFKIPLGIRMFAPDGWWVELRPRSGTFMNDHIHSLYGVIDETYENELTFAGIYIPDGNKILAANSPTTIQFGRRIAQIIPVYRREMTIEEIDNSGYDELCRNRNDPRGTGGYGSSGAV